MIQMVIFIFSLILIFAVDILLVGISFYALRKRFNWNLAPKMCFVILIVIFALLENYIVPMIFVLDATITIRNAEITKLFDISPNYPLINLFSLGFFDFIIWSVQEFVAGIIGERLFHKDAKETI